MARDPINIGSAPDAGDGDYLRVAFGKTENNFVEIYNSFIMTATLTTGNSTVNSSLSNTGVLRLGSTTANAIVNSSSHYIINSTANVTLLANSISFSSNAANSASRVTLYDIYVGNSSGNVLITAANSTLVFAGNSSTKSTFSANNSGVVVGNSSSVASPQISLQNSSSQAVFDTRSIALGNSTATVAPSVTIQNLTSSFVTNSAGGLVTVGSNSFFFNTNYQLLANATSNVLITPIKVSFNEDTTVVNNSGLYVNNSLTYVNTTSFYTSNSIANMQLSVAGLTFNANGAAYIRMGNSTINTASNSSTLYFSTSTSNAVLTSNGLSVNLSVINATSIASGNVFANVVSANLIFVDANDIVNTSGIFASGANISGNSFLIGAVVTSNNLTVGANLAITGNVTTNATFAGLAGFGKVAANAFVDIAAGNTLNAPLKFAAGANLATQTAGALEYDGTLFYATPGAASRGIVTTPQYFMLGANTAGGTASGTSYSMFTVGCNLPIGRYFYDIYFAVSHSAAVATNLQYAITTSTGSITYHNYHVISYASTSASPGGGTLYTSNMTANYLTSGLTSLTAVCPATPATAGTFNVVRIRGYIDVSVAVTGFKPQYGFSGAVSTSTILGGSYIYIWPVGSITGNTSVGTWA